MLIDEAAYVNQDLFYHTLIPILGMKRTALWMISTPGDEDNYYSTLLELKNEDGTPFFKVFKISNICQKCKKLDNKKQLNCPHMEKHTESWKSSSRTKRLKRLYEGDEATALREFAGEVASDHTACFRKDDIENTWKLPPLILYYLIF